MVSISLCMIVKNEEKVLARCLESVKDVVDEIVIVDTGSSDRTKEIARRYTDRVYDHPWKDDFAGARNFAFEKGREDYLMWMDADDILPEKSVGKLAELKETMSADTDMVMMPYAVAFDQGGRCTFSYYRERIVRREAGLRFRGRIHEVIPPAGRIVYEEIPVEHHRVRTEDSTRNLDIYTKMEAEGEEFDGRALYYYGRELVYHKMYEKGARILEEFLGRGDAWLENKIDATRQLAVCRYGLGDEAGALKSLLMALEYDVPRGETCCDLGRHFLDREKYTQAAYWYKEALSAKKDLTSGAFIQEDCYGFLPAIFLCVCCDRMGEKEKARRYNALAGTFKPDSPYYLHNLKYFDES